jgi:Beta-lactamase
MRLVVLTALTALLLIEAPPLALRVQADEVRYKGRPKPPTEDNNPSRKPPVYKPPPDRPQPPPPPPSKEHPDKKPPEPRRPPDPPSPPPPPPPPHGPNWPQPPIDPPCPPHPPCPPKPWPLPPGEIYPIVDPCPDPPVIAPGPVGIDGVLSQKMRLMHIEGFAGEVVVGFNGHIAFTSSYSAGGYYDIGSATEAFTAWAVYRLVGDGKLALGTTLGEVFPFAPAEKRGITIEQLLGNTSGLGNTFAADGEMDRDTAVRKLLAQPLAQAPGADFHHSDDGYVILAAAISVASGMRYERYLMQSGVVGHDMTSTLFWVDLRSGHGNEDWGKRGSGGIFSTARDLYTWASRFVDQPEYVTNEIMQPRARTDNGVGIGYGWFSWADREVSTVWMSGTGESDENVRVVVYPGGAILAVTSDRYHGDVPWSERVANTLEPVLYDWAPPSPSPWKVLSSTSTDEGHVTLDGDAR